ncbi:hypothetical protein GCM10020295_25630 [Streptomyces cinereospinus]
MLGFRGHFSTKSRAYSVTLGALRQERADHNEALARERAAEAAIRCPTRTPSSSSRTGASPALG